MKEILYGAGKVALYVAISSVVAALLDYFKALDLSQSSVFAVTTVGIINVILYAVKNFADAQKK